jgi:hypothetical protein
MAFFPEIEFNLRLVTQAFATRSSRVRHRLWIVVPLAAAAVMSAAACGDDKVAPQQAVLWFGLSTAQGATCSSSKNYQLPDGARATISGTTGVGDRLKDGGDNLVECDVGRVGGSTTNYNVSLRFQGGEIGNFVARGVLTDGAAPGAAGTLNVTFNTGQFALAQSQCTVDVDTLAPGAIWLRGLRCDGLKDLSSPGISCDGQGGLIFENCSH